MVDRSEMTPIACFTNAGGIRSAFRSNLNWQTNNGGTGMETLILGLGIFAGIWIVVLWGARYFGPRDA